MPYDLFDDLLDLEYDLMSYEGRIAVNFGTVAGSIASVIACYDHPHDESDECAVVQLMPYNSEQENIAEATDEDPYLIGFEVEKEDPDFCDVTSDEELDWDNTVTLALMNDWLCVSDSSLDEFGFELVSPAYNLTAADGFFSRLDMERDFRNLPSLDAEYSENCGGHITVSRKGMTGGELVDHFGDLSPLLMAMYPERLLGGHAAGWSLDQTKSRTAKHRAINCKKDRVEFRVFPAVESGKQLSRRAGIIREAAAIADHPEKNIKKELENDDSPLCKLLKDEVSCLEELRERFDHFEEFWRNGITSPEIWEYV